MPNFFLALFHLQNLQSWMKNGRFIFAKRFIFLGWYKTSFVLPRSAKRSYVFCTIPTPTAENKFCTDVDNQYLRFLAVVVTFRWKNSTSRMKKPALFLLLGAGALAALAFVRKATAAGNLVFYPQKITSIAVDGASPVITATAQVQNSSNVPIVINSIAGNIFVNDTLIGNGSMMTRATIPAAGSAVVSLTFRLSSFMLAQGIMNAFTGNGYSQTISWAAIVNIEGLPVQTVNLKFKVGA